MIFPSGVELPTNTGMARPDSTFIKVRCYVARDGAIDDDLARVLRIVGWTCTPQAEQAGQARKPRTQTTALVRLFSWHRC